MAAAVEPAPRQTGEPGPGALESRVAWRRGRQLPANGADLDHGPGLARPRPAPRTSLRNRPAILGRPGPIDLIDHNSPTFALFVRTYAHRLISNAYRLRSQAHGFVSRRSLAGSVVPKQQGWRVPA